MTAPRPDHCSTRGLLIVTITAVGLNVGLPALVATREALEPATLAAILYVLGGVAAAGIAAIVGQAFVGGKLFSGLGKFQFALCSMLLTCAAIEGLFTLAPGLFPGRLRSEVQQPDVERQRNLVVEYLPHAPFAKPKPDVVIRVPGYYGPPEQFEYEWRTDRRGFKNLPALAAKDSFTAVAVGDSFTEGMGVRTEHTWTSRLAARGIDAYNLGVQGYAPTQIAGTFQHYGLPLKARWVIVGYLGGIFDREAHFAGDVDVLQPDALPSGIGRLVADDLAARRREQLNIAEPAQRELRKQYRYFTVALLARAARTFRGEEPIPEWLKAGIADADNDPRFMSREKLVADSGIRIGLMQRYRAEIAAAGKTVTSAAALDADSRWQSTLQRFDDIHRAARAADARMLIVMFRNRGNIYAEHATGSPLPDDAREETERVQLEKFAAERGIEFLDLKPAFLQAVARIDDATPIEAYPYLPIDGHPSPVGHEIIADEIAARLKYLGVDRPAAVAERQPAAARR